MENILPIAGCILLGIGFFLALGYAIKLLWNWLLPNVAAIKKITYLQALGILILARILFGGFGHCGHGWAKYGNCDDKSAYCEKWNSFGYKDGADKKSEK